MGFDCTLHVVDPASLDRFVERFLNGVSVDSRFEDRISDAAGRVDEVVHLIDDEEYFDAARALTELALAFVSTHTPYLDCRGFALSLWDDAVMGTPAPKERFGSIAARLAPILDLTPELRAHVPEEFDSNGCTGVFVAPEDVPHVLHVVDAALAAMRPGDRPPFSPLQRVLRVAADRGLAYWEGADLDVASVEPEWFDDSLPESVESLSVPKGRHLSRLTRDGTRDCFWGVGETIVVDFETSPPTLTVHDIHSMAAVFEASGRLVTLSTVDLDEVPYRFSLFAIDATSHRRLVDALPFPPAGLLVRGDTVFVLPDDPEREGVSSHRPLVLRGDVLAPLEHGSNLPRPESADRVRVGNVTYDVVDFRLVASDSRESPIALDNVMHLAAGPDESLLVCEGWNPEADSAKVFWPRTSEVTSVPSSAFGSDEGYSSFARYSATDERLYVGFEGMIRSIPWASVESLPRVAAHEFEGVDRSRFPEKHANRSSAQTVTVSTTSRITLVFLVLVLVVVGYLLLSARR